MEFYLYVTKDCNLSCTYCSGIGLKRNVESGANGNQIEDTSVLMERLSRLLRQTKESNLDSNNTLVFYGGEPLLNQRLIKEIMESTLNNDLKYIMYTNGILLDQVEPYILDHLDYLFVSVDGDQRVHELHRGRGTFKKIVENVVSIRRRFKGEILARLTVSMEGSLYEMVMGAINLFDHVFWQIESSGRTKNMSTFANAYVRDINLLVDYWLRNIESGIMKNIVPFQAIAASLLLDRKHECLRCGCGSSLVVMDIDGSCYSCDQLMGVEEFKIGDALNGIKYNGDFLYKGMMPSCEKCEVRTICGGRCLHDFLRCPPQKRQMLCNLTMHTIKALEAEIPRVSRSIDTGRISLHDLDTYVSKNCVEEIP